MKNQICLFRLRFYFCDKLWATLTLCNFVLSYQNNVIYSLHNSHVHRMALFKKWQKIELVSVSGQMRQRGKYCKRFLIISTMRVKTAIQLTRSVNIASSILNSMEASATINSLEWNVRVNPNFVWKTESKFVVHWSYDDAKRWALRALCTKKN